MRLYLDNCCFNRPFDDQTQLKISLIIKEPFDYTKWQRGLFEKEDVRSLSSKAMDAANNI